MEFISLVSVVLLMGSALRAEWKEKPPSAASPNTLSSSLRKLEEAGLESEEAATADEDMFNIGGGPVAVTEGVVVTIGGIAAGAAVS